MPLAAVLTSALGSGALGAQPPTVDFVRDVQPLLEARCAECHAYGRAKGGFSLETRASMLRHPGAVVARDAGSSTLLALVRGDDPDVVMPPRGEALTADQVATLGRWIDEGAAWPDDVALRAKWVAPVLPRRPTVPEGPGRTAIDRFVAAYAATRGVDLAPLVDDRAFARRVSLDLVGLPPTPAALDAFLAAPAPDRRERLVNALLDDRTAYAEHWLTFWNDLLRNDYRGTGYIDGGRRQITRWLLGALEGNTPYDEFVAALVNPAPEAAGFANGITWRGEFNSAQSPPMQYSQNVAQVFLGENMKCASCHDSFIDAWTLEDAYGLAAIWSDAPLELHRCDIPTGRTAVAAFPFAEIGDVDPDAPRDERLARLADLMTCDENGRLARTLVNRLWSRLFGRGLVEPVDVMSGEPWSPDLLDWLASDLADHGYDVRRTLALIASSDAYQRRALHALPGDAYRFTGPVPRRLTAEQVLDSIWMVTDTGPANRRAPRSTAVRRAAWIWSSAEASSGAPAGETRTFRRRFDLAEIPATAHVVITCDNAYVLLVNGVEVARDADWPSVETIDVADHLRRGSNELLVIARNAGSSPNAAALLLEARLGAAVIVSDAGWTWSDGSGEQAAVPVAKQRFLGPAVNDAFDAALLALDGRDHFVRASVVNADALMRSLGRPNREQVVSTRPRELTMLQALDLTNGTIYAELMERAAVELGRREGDLVNALYVSLLARPPTDAERRVADDILDAAPDEQGCADLLWVITMLPEFQLLP
jgi:hypothetical protein